MAVKVAQETRLGDLFEKEGPAIGTQALQDNSIGFENTATGNGAPQSNTTGFNNTASGVNAL